MSLLAKLKSILGLRGETENTQDVGVTVERDPEQPVEDSAATNGSDQAASDAGDAVASEAAAGGSTAESETSPEPDHTRATTSESTPEDADTSDEKSSRTRARADSSSEPSTSAPAVTDDGTPVTDIKGIGDAYGDRLAGAGVEFVEQLAEADAAALASETEIAEGRLQSWIEKAQNR